MYTNTMSTTSTVTPINKSENIINSHFTSKSLYGRDVVLINPFIGGNGDHVLANKIANIALNEGCRVTISSVDANEPKKIILRNLSMRDNVVHTIGELYNPIFVVAPLDIFNSTYLVDHINQLCDKYQFPKHDIVLIEEMDLLCSKNKGLSHYETVIDGIGFERISAYNLGFGVDSIGYLPTDTGTKDAIKARFKGELLKLIDSNNMSLAQDSHYHLAYISSKLMITGMQVFIANTLSETMTEDKDHNYIMVMRQLNSEVKHKLPTALKDILELKNDQFDLLGLFAKATLFFANPDNGNLTRSIEITGQGKAKINVVITQSLPHPIFEDFMCLSHSGMASGDQSLGEFLSLTGKMPYYDTQTWKYPLAQAIMNMGGAELQQYIAQKIVGVKPVSAEIFYQLAANQNQPEPSPEIHSQQDELDRKLSSRTATEVIRKHFMARKNTLSRA
ncbi:hypothetical protein SJI19_13625 [Acerihabitans sp. TG2]|uniref:hypothetical protein n=1 Tax=Acerihabitans sp. TG2 TaxID=3096008 RepID=UPI002B23B284|nr:hypothetical protein [Acerihabitans sp. TG2]MEA9391569.1 hypothetical protein [Acerihabitans sp. TG2]